MNTPKIADGEVGISLRSKDHAQLERYANLFCAAPDLLKACKSALKMTGHNHWDSTMRDGACPLCIKHREIVAIIKTAIDKAEGKVNE